MSAGAGCLHNGDLVSAPMTAANQNPEHRCADCDAVVIPGSSLVSEALSHTESYRYMEECEADG